ncbi:hypothetical protein KsCSTR_20010 [Candidatus Kuenenia stuttgartiensis]|uniref:Uncharacterized protein n=1 Tax=Kuenenia stuttgartiensis TaxID=174633 RepID=A0A6G7GP44_KUEST|nr:hypothetical protein KsCSTR_20010 [Candidatus Kuenenia stuttgartiensis]
MFRYHLSYPMVNYAERGNTVISPYATHGRSTARQTDERAVLRSWKKQMSFYNGVNRV